MEEATGGAGMVVVEMVEMVEMVGEMMLSAHLTSAGRRSWSLSGGGVGGNGRGWCDRSLAGTGRHAARCLIDVSGNFNAWAGIGEDVGLGVWAARGHATWGWGWGWGWGGGGQGIGSLKGGDVASAKSAAMAGTGRRAIDGSSIHSGVWL
jgi:hypothetical protein